MKETTTESRPISTQTDWPMMGILLGSYAIFCYFTYIIMVSVYSVYWHRLKSVDALYSQLKDGYTIPAILLGFVIGTYSLRFLLKAITGKEKSNSYCEISEKLTSLKNKKGISALLTGLTVTSVLLFFWLLRSNSYLSGDTLVVNDLFSIQARTYPLSEIHEVISSKSFQKIQILFNDGFRWNLENSKDLDVFLNKLTEKAKIQITESDTI